MSARFSDFHDRRIIPGLKTEVLESRPLAVLIDGRTRPVNIIETSFVCNIFSVLVYWPRQCWTCLRGFRPFDDHSIRRSDAGIPAGRSSDIRNPISRHSSVGRPLGTLSVSQKKYDLDMAVCTYALSVNWAVSVQDPPTRRHSPFGRTIPCKKSVSRSEFNF